MSRVRRFAHSLFSGYILLGANTLYTLASVPLALKYLSKPEFGLWAVTSTIAQYIGLIDMGMSGASRILIDYKDKRDAGTYGSVIQTFFLVSVVQGALIVLLGIGLAAGLGPALHITAAQQRDFFLLTIGQCALLAGSFLTRVLSYLLAAHQRYDLSNYSQALTFAASFVVLWLGLAKFHQGVFSTLWAQGAAWLLGAGASIGFALKLKLFPAPGGWGRPNWSRFQELFSYGRDIFLVALGFQLLNASQTLILTRLLGLEAAAVWSVCTRTFVLLSQLIYRMLDYSAAALAEMIVRGEQSLLHRRFRSLTTLSASAAVVAAVGFAVCNQPFVLLWTGPKMSWPPFNDALLAVSLVILAAARCHIGLVGQAKQIGSMRYLYAAEGVFFVGLSLLVVPRGGVPAMLLASITGTLLFSFPYGTWRTSRYFKIPWRQVAFEWMLPPLRLALLLAPVGFIVAWLAKPLPPAAYLAVCAAVIGLAGVALFFRFGLDDNLQTELWTRSPARLRPWLPLLSGRRALLK